MRVLSPSALRWNHPGRQRASTSSRTPRWGSSATAPVRCQAFVRGPGGNGPAGRRDVGASSSGAGRPGNALIDGLMADLTCAGPGGA